MSVQPDSLARVDLEQQRKRAKDLKRAHRDGLLEAAVRICRHLPRARGATPAAILAAPCKLTEAQLVVAREAGFETWPAMTLALAEAPARTADGEDVIDAALAGRDDDVRRSVADDADAAQRSIHVAAVLADGPAVAAHLAADPALVDRAGGRRLWTPLLYLCCSRYGRRESETIAARVELARVLLEGGADPSFAGREPGLTDVEWRPLDGAASAVASAELVQRLVAAGAVIAKTPFVLVHGVQGGDLDVVRRLLDGAPADWHQIGWALLECAVQGRTDMAEVLVAHAAPQGSTRIARKGLLEAMRQHASSELVAALLGDDTSELALPLRQELYRAAVRFGHRAAVELLERMGADARAVTAVDAAIGDCVTGDREPPVPAPSDLGDDEHRMLVWAIRTDRHAAVPRLLGIGLDPNVPDRDGALPLHLAVGAGSLQLVGTLLRSGANVDALDFEARTPLDVALAHPDPETRERLTRRLVEAGADPARTDALRASADRPPLDAASFEQAADAVAAGDLPALRELLDQHPDLVRARSPRAHHCTLLHYCAANGTEDLRQRTPANAPAIAELLLERGADPNAACDLYGTACTTMGLMLTSALPVAAGLDGELTRVLLRFGAKLDPAEMMVAMEYGLTRSVAAFVAAGAPVDNLFVAAGLGRRDVMADLLARGADIDARYPAGGFGTALHAAAAMGQTEAAELLLDRGADASRHNRWDATPAGTASHFGHRELARMIEARRGKPRDA